MKRILIPAVAAMAAVALAPSSSASAAAAAADGGREFGEHVVHCIDAVGFDGAHNPGTHQGFHGFTDHVCVMA